MKREQAYNRDYLSYNEKMDICQKSDYRCCHCGTIKYVNYGATLDHFIPISKGGSNRYLNLIMLCEDCNQDKKDKIVTIDYVPYLKDKYKIELQKYIDSYIKVIDYVERNRLLAYDEYSIKLPTVVTHRHNNYKSLYSKIKLKRATIDDLDKLYKYYCKYLDKYNRLDSKDAAKKNIQFWLTFGCIYYIERHNEIVLMVPITVKHISPEYRFRNVENRLNMYIFSYYHTDYSILCVMHIIQSLPMIIMEEQDFMYLPIIVNTLPEDKMTNSITAYLNLKSETPVVVYQELTDINSIDIVLFRYDAPININDLTEKDDEKIQKFSKLFNNDIKEDLIKYFSNYEDNDFIGWMILNLLSKDDIIDTELDKLIN